MPKKIHSNTEALRKEFSDKLSIAIQGVPRKSVAAKLGISRQMLQLYLNRKATPGGEVIKKACDEWQLTLSIKGFEFPGEAFASMPKARRQKLMSNEPGLFDLLDRLNKDQLEAEIVGREGDSYYLRLRIKLAA